MEQACQADNTARERGQPAVHKLKMLPEVVALLNRNTVRHSIVDPDTNFLLSVKFFLEPLNDGSLPAYNIQRDLFNALAQLPIEKEALLSSGIGKVVLYYTKSKRPEIGIKRIAERLLGEWSRPILKRSDDYKKRKIATKEYDFQYVSPSELERRVLTVFPGPHSSPFAHPAHSLRASHPMDCHGRSWIASAYWPRQSRVTGLGWRRTVPVIQLRPRVLLIRREQWTQRAGQLVQVAWRRSGR
jgi:hypothetical protein